MVSKDAFYFTHDSNAKDDPKIIQLIEEMGLEGYGIYWILLELMRDQKNYKYKLYLVPAIARRYNTTFEKIKNVITKYGLFVIEDDEFYSIAFINRMTAWDEIKEKRSNAGKKGNEIRWGKKSHSDKLAITDGIANNSEEIAIKEKKRKEYNIYIVQFFDQIWSKYPNKKGKSKINFAQKEKLYKLKDQIFLCIENYLKDSELEINGGWKKLQNGDRFFNKTYEEYLCSTQKIKNSKCSKSWKDEIKVEEVYLNEE